MLENSNQSPPITVGILTYNREWSLGRVLEAVHNLDYDKGKIRICFVDNKSSDGTVGIIEEFRSKFAGEYESITLDVCAPPHIPTSRNICFRKAAGTDYMFFLDSDIIPPPDTIPRLLGHFKKDPTVGIASLPSDRRNARKRAGPFYNSFWTPNDPVPAYKVGSGCTIISMKVFERIGFFNQRLRVHEDGEYCYRARRSGFKIICDFSSEGNHLRGITLNSRYYLNFMRDSAETYVELIKEGSSLHLAKLISSISLVASLVYFVVARSLYSGVLFGSIAIFAIWLNSDKRTFDDGVHVKLKHRPLVGVLLTIATVLITAMSVLKFVVPRPVRRHDDSKSF